MLPVEVALLSLVLAQCIYTLGTNMSAVHFCLSFQLLSMNRFLQLAFFVAAAALCSAAPQQYNTPIPIVAQYQDGPNPDGTYQYSYQTANGIAAEERGYLKNAGQPEIEAQVAEGSYQYTSDDGVPISIRYIADEGGFRAEGSAIPTPPPIPPEIARALEYLRTLPQQQYDDNGNPIGGPVSPAPYQPYRGKK